MVTRGKWKTEMTTCLIVSTPSSYSQLITPLKHRERDFPRDITKDSKNNPPRWQGNENLE